MKETAKVIVRNQFANKNVGTGSKGIAAFIEQYMFRDDALAPMVGSSQQLQRCLELLTQLNTPEDLDSINLLRNKMKGEAIGFDSSSVSLSLEDEYSHAHEAEAAYQRGGTILQMVVSFDTNYLRKHGVLKLGPNEIVHRGDLIDKIDQQSIRRSVQKGMSKLFAYHRMKKPEFIAAVQVDTNNVHVHITSWDQTHRQQVHERGKISNKERKVMALAISIEIETASKLLNNSQELENLAKLTAQNARFKRHGLEEDLKKLAWQMNPQDEQQYLSDLESFNQTKLPDSKKATLKRKVTRDLQHANNTVTKRSEPTSKGLLRRHRQWQAMVKASELRTQIEEYNDASLRGKTSESSRVVKTALCQEYRRQLTIVEKYRDYQRGKTDSIYETHKQELSAQRNKLVKLREELLPQLNTKPISTATLNDLLTDQPFLENLARANHGKLLSSTTYQELKRSQDHPDAPLTISVINAVVDNVPTEKAGYTYHALTSNQVIQPSTFNAAQQSLLNRYLNELEEYEMDAASLGGLNATFLKINNTDVVTLPIPNKTSSIYERPRALDNPSTVSVDAHDIVSRGPFKPEIEVAMREQVMNRSEYLIAAKDYFDQTEQTTPTWLSQSITNLDQQYLTLNGSKQTGNVDLSESITEHLGHQLEPATVTQMVNKHIALVNIMDLER